jgi:hypothetical protein
MTAWPGNPAEPGTTASGGSPVHPGRGDPGCGEPRETSEAGGAVESGRRALAGCEGEAGGLRQPAAFAKEVRAAVRYEGGLVVKAAAVLAALALIFVLRALYFS